MIQICQRCGKKHINVNTLIEIKTAPIPKRWDGINKEVIEQTKRYKCDACGFTFKLRVEPKVDQKPIENKDKIQVETEEQYFKKWQNEMVQSIRNKN